MKKLVKLTALLLGALFILLGCRSESKSVFVYEYSGNKVQLTYVYDKDKDSISSLNILASYAPQTDSQAELGRQLRTKLTDEIKQLEGVKVSVSEKDKEATMTIDIDLNKFKLEDDGNRKKAPNFYSTLDIALVKKGGVFSYEASKESILSDGFKEQK